MRSFLSQMQMIAYFPSKAEAQTALVWSRSWKRAMPGRRYFGFRNKGYKV